MSGTRGEGRAPAEKAARVIEPVAVRKARRERRAAEEKNWAERSGPVTVRREMSEQTPPCPDCAQGKHLICDGTSWNPQRDEPDGCPCAEKGHEAHDAKHVCPDDCRLASCEEQA